MSGKTTLNKVVQWAITLPVGGVFLYACHKVGYWTGEHMAGWRREKKRSPELEAAWAKTREEIRLDVESAVAEIKRISEAGSKR